MTIALSSEDLAELHLLEYWDSAADDWKVAKGDYGVAVGGSSDAAIADAFTIK